VDVLGKPPHLRADEAGGDRIDAAPSHFDNSSVFDADLEAACVRTVEGTD
jgi:hypothetical protein